MQRLVLFTGQLETQEATMKLQHLSKKVDQLKLEVHEATVSKYTNFLTQLHNTEQLVADVQAIKAEMDDVAGKIENQVGIHRYTCTYIYQVDCYMYNFQLNLV